MYAFKTLPAKKPERDTGFHTNNGTSIQKILPDAQIPHLSQSFHSSVPPLTCSTQKVDLLQEILTNFAEGH